MTGSTVYERDGCPPGGFNAKCKRRQLISVCPNSRRPTSFEPVKISRPADGPSGRGRGPPEGAAVAVRFWAGEKRMSCPPRVRTYAYSLPQSETMHTRAPPRDLHMMRRPAQICVWVLAAQTFGFLARFGLNCSLISGLKVDIKNRVKFVRRAL